MKEFEIWVEGHFVQGMFIKPRHIAVAYAETFKEACNHIFSADTHFDHERLTYRGHSLFHLGPEGLNERRIRI